ncbi:hypothetical protein DEU56DRAFT_982337 [Suillus clintonianus]|uniref:uncharacterized protein n=1 Tax=Suillus clintonianus TaxID=1904413 RepID=UPI001B87CBDA|nr:uncharacterized protein DEU56DRAFT_982337 [Suillus clintonianus]KAG2129476.1 hypothetical protein DEU56DRAFT_982337 [Suillus clintonianus]
MKPKAGFLSLAEELQFYILISLPYRDILRCSSVCKALRQTYLSYSELQYIVELGGQQLLRVPDINPDNRISISRRLQLLRNRAHAWFRLDVNTCTTIFLPDQFRNSGTPSIRVANRHLCLWDNSEKSATILPILPDASQQTIERDCYPRSLYSGPYAHTFEVFMDPAQNLIAVVHAGTGYDPIANWGYAEMFCIDLRALDGGGYHPQAAGHTLVLSELPGCEEPVVEPEPDNVKLKGFGKHIALWRTLQVNDVNDGFCHRWALQIWDWQHSTTSSCVLTDDINPDYDDAADFCFLGNDRLLVFSHKLKLYSIEDTTQAPQLLACFLLPISAMDTGFAECILPMEDSLQPPMQAQQTMWTSDPQHQLFILSIETFFSTLVFIISTTTFFDLDFSSEMAAEIPWNDWGPSNSRVLQNQTECRIGVSGNRVLQACPVDDTTDEHDPSHITEFRLCAMDFSPLAIERLQGVGRVVKEPSTIIIETPDLLPQVTLTTNLPYVEVVLDKTFSYPLGGIWIDKDAVYLCHGYQSDIEVIEITPRAGD